MGGGAPSFAGRHDGGRPRDGKSIAVLLIATTPGRLFSPLERKFFDSAAQHEPCRKLVGNPSRGINRRKAEKQTGWCWEESKKIELCAALAEAARSGRGEPSGATCSEVNLVRSHRKVVTTS